MKIGLNGQRLLIKEPAGPEKYTYHIFNALAKIDKENLYTIYFNEVPDDKYFSDLTNNNPNFKYKVIQSKYSWTQCGLSKELFRNPQDALFTPVHTIPILRPKKLKISALIHGLEYRYTKGYKNFLKRCLINKPEWYTCVFSTNIITPSNATRDEILNKKWIGVNKNKISVIPEGVSDNFYKRNEEETNKVLSKYQVEYKKYLLFVSTIQPRKNLPITIEAFSDLLKSETELLNRKGLDNIKFVVVGKKGWDYEESLKSPEKYNIKDKVSFLGRVSDQDLPYIYSGALAYINISLEEGFGLPLLEAMASEVPCLVSDIPPFREIDGNNNFLVFSNPKSAEDIKNKMKLILNLETTSNSFEDSKSIIQKGLKRSKEFSWETAAHKTLSVIAKLD